MLGVAGNSNLVEGNVYLAVDADNSGVGTRLVGFAFCFPTCSERIFGICGRSFLFEQSAKDLAAALWGHEATRRQSSVLRVFMKSVSRLEG